MLGDKPIPKQDPRQAYGGHLALLKHARYRSGQSSDWLKFKNPDATAVKREAEEEWR